MRSFVVFIFALLMLLTETESTPVIMIETITITIESSIRLKAFLNFFSVIFFIIYFDNFIFVPIFRGLVWGYSSVGRAPALQAGGQEFEPPYLHHFFKNKNDKSSKKICSISSWNFFRIGNFYFNSALLLQRKLRCSLSRSCKKYLRDLHHQHQWCNYWPMSRVFRWLY